MLFNVEYKDLSSGKKRRYLAVNTDRATAEKHCGIFNSRYPSKPYPNGKGFYNYSRAEVVEAR